MPSAETNILNRLASAPTFHPVTADLFVDDWGLDAGDVVSVKSGDTTYNVPIYNMELDWHGSARAQIQSTGNRERKPLSALKRKEFRTGRGGYGTKKVVDEQSVQYERHFEATDRRVTSTMRATGVQVDENGNPVMVYNPETGEYEYAFDTSGQGVTLASRVWQTAGEMGTLVEMTGINNLGVEETLYSKITQNAQNITLEAARRQNDVNTLSGRITVEAGKITQIVEAVGDDGEVTAASIVTAINNGSSSVVISADHIELDGDTVASILYGKQVEVDEINAASADFSSLDVEEGLYVNGVATFIDSATFQGVDIQSGLTVNAITLNGMAVNVVDITKSGNILTITKANGTTITFNKATTLSGGWSSGVYTVTAQQEQTDVATDTTSLTVTGHWGNASNNESTTTYYGDIKATRNSSATIYDTGKTFTVNASSIAGIDTITKNAESTNPRDYDTWSGTSIGTLAEDTYYQIKATPNAGASAFIKFKTAASSGGQGGIASVSAGGWTWANNTYTNTVTAVANDGTSDTVGVILPTISCQVGTGTSDNATIRPYGPGNHILPTGTSLTLYLKSDDNYVYLTNANATPAVGTNVVARAGNNAHSQGGVSTAALNAHTDNSDDIESWTWDKGINLSDRYNLVLVTANDGSTYTVELNASGVYTNGRNSGLPTSLSTAGANGYTATTDVGSITANMAGGGYIYTAGTGATGSDGVAYLIVKLTAVNAAGDEVYTKYAYNKTGPTSIYKKGYTTGYNNAPVGLASGTGLVNWVASSNESSVYDGWAYQDTISMGGYKYRQYEVVAADGSKAYIKIHAENTYNAGANSVTISSATRTAQSNDSSTISGTDSSIGSAGYKYFVITATASNNQTRTIGVNATPTYNNGWNNLCAKGSDSDYAQFSGSSSATSALSKSNGTVSGYIWLKNVSGTWVKGRNISISTADCYNKSVTLTYKGSVDGVYTWTTSTYVSGLTVGNRYTVRFNV